MNQVETENDAIVTASMNKKGWKSTKSKKMNRLKKSETFQELRNFFPENTEINFDGKTNLSLSRWSVAINHLSKSFFSLSVKQARTEKAPWKKYFSLIFEVSFCSLLPESVIKLIWRGTTCLKTETVFKTELVDEAILPLVALAAQGCKWSSCAPTLLDLHSLVKAAGDNSSGFSDLHYASLSTGYQ